MGNNLRLGPVAWASRILNIKEDTFSGTAQQRCSFEAFFAELTTKTFIF